MAGLVFGFSKGRTLKSIPEAGDSRSAFSKYSRSLGTLNDTRGGDVIVSWKPDWEDVVALIEDLRVEIENFGDCKPEVFTELVGGSIAEDAFGLRGSGGRYTTDELVEPRTDGCRGGLRLALRCGIGGGGLVFWGCPTCDEKFLLESGVAGGEGGHLGGNP